MTQLKALTTLEKTRVPFAVAYISVTPVLGKYMVHRHTSKKTHKIKKKKKTWAEWKTVSFFSFSIFITLY